MIGNLENDILVIYISCNYHIETDDIFAIYILKYRLA